MSRTTLCLTTAAVLAVLSITIMAVRYRVLGDEVKAPTGPNCWKVAMVVQGQSQGDSRLLTATPLDFGHQHIVREECRSRELADRPPDAKHPDRRQVIWSQRGGVPAGRFRATYEFHCVVDTPRPTSPMSHLSRELYAAPAPGTHLDVESKDGTDNEKISALARRLTAGLERNADQAEVLFRYVNHDIANEPSFGGVTLSAAECLENESGDAGGKSRLLLALLRNRGIPARMVTGLTLTKGPDQLAHYWVEAWIHDRWMPMCSFYHHYGSVPRTYLVFGFGDLRLVRGRHASELDYRFLIEKVPGHEESREESSVLKRAFMALSLYMLPPPEQRLVEFLLLLPVAALIICLFRNVIGLHSFGTFAPALVGLAFRELHTLPGVLVFVSILLVGWVMRRVLDCFHLLQVPRVAVMLTLVVILLISLVVAANFEAWPATKYIPLFPMVILTGMIERFWTLEVEDSTRASFKTLLTTLFISLTIAVSLSFPAIVNHLFRYPETLGLVMAVQILIGRYTGYRLMEVVRFRDFLEHQPAGA